VIAKVAATAGIVAKDPRPAVIRDRGAVIRTGRRRPPGAAAAEEAVVDPHAGGRSAHAAQHRAEESTTPAAATAVAAWPIPATTAAPGEGADQAEQQPHSKQHHQANANPAHDGVPPGLRWPLDANVLHWDSVVRC